MAAPGWQSDRKRGVALAAQHRLGMFPRGVGHHEVIQPVFEWLAGDADGQGALVGEIRQALLSGDVILPEDHLAVGAVFRAPSARYAPLGLLP